MLVSKNAQICVIPNVNPKIYFSPNVKPQNESVEYRLRWVPNAKFSRWPCRFHVVNPAVLSGIWALYIEAETCSDLAWLNVLY